MYVLGFDYGHKNIGVAIGQTIAYTASPLTTIKRQKGPVWSAIELLIQQWQPHAIVIGLPLGLEGEEQAITLAARQFGQTLQNKFKKQYLLDFYWQDERYTSQAAQSLYPKDQPMRKKNQKQSWDRDAVAAMLIVEAWLATRAMADPST